MGKWPLCGLHGKARRLSETARRPGTQYPRFFGDLGTHLGEVRRASRRRYLQFFAELSPRLDTARALEFELDRQLARRFNVFDYLSTSEVGLSTIVADLLNPEARHGQGTLFLRTLLGELTEIRHRPQLDVDSTKRISVVTERVITKKRRLDISVEIPGSDGPYCLAIENKPYAGDQRNQVKDYLAFLKHEYSDRFLLIYLSPTGQGPSKWSLPRKNLDRWEGRLAIMAYCGETNGMDSEEPTAEDRFAGFRVELSLATWFSACRRRCEPDRLRWFLSEAERFCRHQFGGYSMATDSGTRTIRDFLFANPKHLETAQAVSEAWPNIKEGLCSRFLEHLRKILSSRAREDLSGIAPDIRVESEYRGESRWANFLWLYRDSWTPWENHAEHPPYQGCTAIVMQSKSPGPNGWRWGVLHPLDKSRLTSRDEQRRTLLEQKLRSELDGGRSKGWWPYLRRVDDEMCNWNSLLPDLYREWKDGGGSITDFYVDGLIDIATKAIPIINEVERTHGDS